MSSGVAERRFPDPRCREVLEYYLADAMRPDCELEVFRRRTRKWFMRDPVMDAEIRQRFSVDVERAAAGELEGWASSALGRLGLIVLLDQFPRNLNRDSALAFTHDARALRCTQEGIALGVDRELTSGERMVFYLTLMHAEDLTIQDQCHALYSDLATHGAEALRPELGMALVAATRHRDIIQRFGRFPHRNQSLGRASTPEELRFLGEPNSSF